jgi:hypothetical protein
MSEDDQKIKASARRNYTQHVDVRKTPEYQRRKWRFIFSLDFPLGMLLLLIDWMRRLPSTKLGFYLALVWMLMGFAAMLGHVQSWKNAADQMLSYQIWEKVFMYSLYGVGAIFTIGGLLLLIFGMHRLGQDPEE